MCAKRINPKKAVLAQGIVVEGVDPKLQKKAVKKYRRPSHAQLMEEAMDQIREEQELGDMDLPEMEGAS